VGPHILIKRLVELFASKRIQFIGHGAMFKTRLLTRCQPIAGLLQQVELDLLVRGASGESKKQEQDHPSHGFSPARR
jgi:hypothetical protein